MTSQNDQIQVLIAELDGVLSKSSPRLPWVMSGDAAQQRQLLERIRDFLESLQPDTGVGERQGQAGGRQDLMAFDVQYPSGSTLPESTPVSADVAQQVLQRVMQEMNYLRSAAMQPLREDLEILNRKRETLIEEIKQLEGQQKQYALAQQQANQQQMMAEFLQVLMGRLQETLNRQVAQTLSKMEAQAFSEQSASGGVSSDTGVGNPPLLPAQRLEQIQALQAQSDQLVLKLDSTLSVFFETMQKNIQSYQDSLSQGLGRMHSLGQQGEVVFTAMVNHLAQQLGREASAYLQPPEADWEATSRLTEQGQEALPPVSQGSGGRSLTSPTEEQTPEFQIESLLNELGVNDTTVTSDGLDLGNELLDPSFSSTMTEQTSPVDQAEDLNLEGLDLSDLDLSNLELGQVDPETYSASPSLTTDLDEDITLFQVDDDPILSLEEDMVQAQDEDATDDELDTDDELAFAASTSSATGITDLDSALDLLNQLSLELQEDSTEPVIEQFEENPVVPEGALLTDELETNEPEVEIPEVETIDQPESIYAELDDFYSSMFGSQSGVTTAEDDITTSSLPPSDETATASGATEDIEEFTEPLTDPATTNSSVDFTDTDSTAELADVDLADIGSVDLDLADQFGGMETVTGTAAPPPTPAANLDSTTSLDDDLFAGLADPAQENLEQEEPGSTVDVTETAQSVEDFLFTDSPDSLTGTETSDVDEPTQGLESLSFQDISQPVVPGPDTISTLTDLVEETSRISQEPLPADLLAPSGDVAPVGSSQSADDAYVPAAPEEDLLAVDEPIDEAGMDLQLDDNTFQQLNEDLYNLEGLEGEDFLLDLEADLRQINEASSSSTQVAEEEQVGAEPPVIPTTAEDSTTEEAPSTLKELEDLTGERILEDELIEDHPLEENSDSADDTFSDLSQDTTTEDFLFAPEPTSVQSAMEGMGDDVFSSSETTFSESAFSEDAIAAELEELFAEPFLSTSSVPEENLSLNDFTDPTIPSIPETPTPETDLIEDLFAPEPAPSIPEEPVTGSVDANFKDFEQDTSIASPTSDSATTENPLAENFFSTDSSFLPAEPTLEEEDSAPSEFVDDLFAPSISPKTPVEDTVTPEDLSSSENLTESTVAEDFLFSETSSEVGNDPMLATNDLTLGAFIDDLPTPPTSQASSDTPEPNTEAAFSMFPSEETNVFTLEALDSLFADLGVAESSPPATESSTRSSPGTVNNPPTETDTQSITLDSAFDNFIEAPSTDEANTQTGDVDEKKK